MRTALNDKGEIVFLEDRKEQPKSSFFTGARIDRFTSDWITRDASLDCLLEHDLCRLRSRSRWLVQNDGYAANWVKQTQCNVIGDGGFRLKMRCKNKRNGIDKTASRTIEEAWRAFCEAGQYDVTGQLSEHAFDCLNLAQIITSGGALTRIVRGFSGNSQRFGLQGIPIDHLDPDYHDNRIGVSMSVEKDEFGRVAGYHLLRNRPNTRHGYREGKRDRYGAEEIVHPFLREEFGQTQGKPWLTPVIARLRQLHGYEEAELIAARAHASKLGFFETDPSSPAGGYTGEGTDEYGNVKMDGSPGSFEKLPPGVTANLIDPSHPNANYPDFRKGMLRGVAAGIVTNYNLLGQDLEGVNYSSIRQGVLAEREMWRMIQRWYIDEFKLPVFRAWLEWSIMVGTLPYSMTDLDRLCHPQFQGRRWDWVDPDKDSKAEERRLKNRLTSHQRIARSRGEDLEQILKEAQEDRQLAEQMELDLFLDMPDVTDTMGQEQEAENS